MGSKVILSILGDRAIRLIVSNLVHMCTFDAIQVDIMHIYYHNNIYFFN